jgi:uncharacterized protein with HEPN domain
MTERDETVYVRHMLDAMDRLESYVKDLSLDELSTDWMRQDAIVRQLEILGEAAGRISRENCDRIPEIPWALVTGMRHRLIHNYFEVNLEMVFDTVVTKVPELRQPLLKLLAQLSEE